VATARLRGQIAIDYRLVRERETAGSELRGQYQVHASEL
jgi:hypothetical protein